MDKTIKALRRAASRAQYAEDQRLLMALALDIERHARIETESPADETPKVGFPFGGTQTEG